MSVRSTRRSAPHRDATLRLGFLSITSIRLPFVNVFGPASSRFDVNCEFILQLLTSVLSASSSGDELSLRVAPTALDVHSLQEFELVRASGNAPELGTDLVRLRL